MSRRDLLMFIFKRKLSIIGLFLVVVVTTTLSVFVVPPTYQAHSLVLVDRARNPGFAAEAQTGTEMVEAVNTAAELAMSRTVVERTVDSLRLGEITERNEAERALTREPTFLDDLTAWMVETGLVAPKAPGRDRWVSQIANNMTASPIINSNMLEISYYDDNPERAAAIVNALTDNYLAHHFEVYKSTGVARFFEEQMNRAGAELERLRTELGRVKERDNIAAIEEMRASLVEEAATLRARLQERRSELRDLLARFTSGHREVRLAQADVGEFQTLLDRAERKISELETKGNSARQLELLLKSEEETFREYKVRYDQARVKEAADPGLVNVRLVDYASVPRTPSFTRLGLILLSIPIGLILGLCVGFLREYFDDRVSDPGQAEEALGFPSYGSVEKLGMLSVLRG